MFIRTLEFISIIVTFVGAILTSLGIDPINVYVLNLGSALWSLWGLVEKKYSIFIVNVGMLAIYIMGSLIRVLELDLQIFIKNLIQ